MKASELIKILEKKIEKFGDLDVYVEQTVYDETCYYTADVGDYVYVSDLSKYDEKLILEYWSCDKTLPVKPNGTYADDPNGPGLIRAICFGSDTIFSRSGDYE